MHAHTESPSTPAKRTIYVLIRQDISIEQQLVQSAHAAAEAGRTFYSHDHGIASLIVLSVPDQAALHAARQRLLSHGIESELFFEPDFGMGHSALATRPLTNDERRHMRRWRLWTLESALKHAPRARTPRPVDAHPTTPSNALETV